MKIVGSTSLGGLWALEWAWHIRVTNMLVILQLVILIMNTYIYFMLHIFPRI